MAETSLPPGPAGRVDGGKGLRLEEATTGYRRGSPTLRGVSFAGSPGEIVAVVGPNGAGKTTLFRALLGFLRLWSGRIVVDGLDPSAYRRTRGVAYLPETIPFPPGWSGMALLREGVRVGTARGPHQREVELARAVARTALPEGELVRPAALLSKGMARRLGLAMVLPGSPSLLLLDEPMTGLDAPSRVRLREEVLAAARRGATIVLASHDLDEVVRVAHRVVLLRRGGVEQVLERGEVTGTNLEELVLGVDVDIRPVGGEE